MPYKDKATRNAARAARKDEINARKRERYANDPALRERRLEEYRKNAEREKANTAEWRKRNPDRVRKYSEDAVKSGRSREANRRFRERHPESRWERYPHRKEPDKAAAKRWRESHPEKARELCRLGRARNRDKINARSRERRRTDPKIREYANQWRRDKWKNDPEWRLLHNSHARVRGLLRGKKGNGSLTVALRSAFGCTISELRAHLERQWQPGMSWDNWKHDGWHIDHIRPLSSFDLLDPEQFAKAWHHSNLRPLWAKDNFSKGGRWAHEAA